MLILALVSPLAAANELAVPVESATPETITVHPYSADLTGLKNEIRSYREAYLVVQSIVVIGLISALATRR